MLETAGKTEIAAQEFDAVLGRETSSSCASSRGAGSPACTRSRAPATSPSRASSGVARDDYAREIDTAPGRLIPDAALTAVAKTLPATKRDLAGFKEFTGRASRTQIDRWWAAIEAGLAIDRPARRCARPGESDPAAPRLGRQEPGGRPSAEGSPAPPSTAAAEQLDIPVENLLTPETLRRVAWTPPAELSVDSHRRRARASSARAPWQIDATAQLICDAFVEALQSPEEPDDAVS